MRYYVGVYGAKAVRLLSEMGFEGVGYKEFRKQPDAVLARVFTLDKNDCPTANAVFYPQTPQLLDGMRKLSSRGG